MLKISAPASQGASAATPVRGWARFSLPTKPWPRSSAGEADGLARRCRAVLAHRPRPAPGWAPAGTRPRSAAVRRGRMRPMTELDEHGRPEPPVAAGEVATLLGFPGLSACHLGLEVLRAGRGRPFMIAALIAVMAITQCRRPARPRRRPRTHAGPGPPAPLPADLHLRPARRR